MSHPFVFARTRPDKPAVIIAETGEILTYRQLEERANQNAHLLRSLGIRRGDCIAAMLENGTAMFELAWAAFRSGIYFTAISTRLTPDEVGYIVKDCGAAAFFTTDQVPEANGLGDVLTGIPAFSRGSDPAFCRDWNAALQPMPITPIADESAGDLMLYSSGTTGRPKGVKRPLIDDGLLVGLTVEPLLRNMFGATENDVYLCPAPLYHAAPLMWSTTMHRFGMTVIVQKKYDAEGALQAIEDHKVTIAQFVPTHFVRMLKLPDDVRAKYDHNSLRLVFHAAAPCPVPIKEAMIEWWGPMLYEYYSGTEGVGVTLIGAEDWQTRKGSVGKAFGCKIHICGPDGETLANGEQGDIYFSGGPKFEYLNDPEKTSASVNEKGWGTLGDIGWLDDEGFLYLTDRKSFMIISGGVNIYPQEIENLLITHPKVMDAAVIGAPDEEMGERVVAIIQPVENVTADPALASELAAFCRANLSGVKIPRQIDFMTELPRHPNGKLYKRLLHDQYRAAAADTQGARAHSQA